MGVMVRFSSLHKPWVCFWVCSLCATSSYLSLLFDRAEAQCGRGKGGSGWLSFALFTGLLLPAVNLHDIFHLAIYEKLFMISKLFPYMWVPMFTTLTREQMVAHIILVILTYCHGSRDKDMTLELKSEDNFCIHVHVLIFDTISSLVLTQIMFAIVGWTIRVVLTNRHWSLGLY
jgi:general stress protein CsbA